MNVGDLEIIR